MARWAVEWRRGPVKRVVSGSFWVVSDGFCWLWVISDGFRWFAVLVVTRIHNIQKSYIFTILKNAYDWLRSFDFFIQSKTARKDYCCLKISDYFLCCIVLYFRSKTFFKRKQSQKKSKWSIANYLKQGVLAERVWKLFKSREIIHANGETGRIQLKWGDLLVG